MSIIFEALKKIERDKKEEDPQSCSSVVFSPPAEGLRKEAAPPHGRRVFRRLLFAAACILVLVLFIKLGRFGYSGRRPTSAAPAPSMPAPVIKEVRLDTKRFLPLETDLVPRPAPAARPAAAPADKIPELHLKGISHSDSKSWAFINDKMVKLGDRVEGAEVVQILSDRVKMKFSGVEFTLTY